MYMKNSNITDLPEINCKTIFCVWWLLAVFLLLINVSSASFRLSTFQAFNRNSFVLGDPNTQGELPKQEG